MSALQKIINARKTALLQTYVRETVPPVVEWESLEHLGTKTFLDEFEMVDDEEQLGRRNPNSVGVLLGRGDHDRTASVWVSAKYKGYRSAYLAFVRTVYQIDCTKKDLEGYDVDHLLNRARSGDRDVYLRIEAVPSTINRLWGAVFEKSASNDEYEGNKRTRRLMSQAIAAKLAGLQPPSNSRDRIGIRKIADHFAGLGMSRAEVIQHMETLLQKNEFFA